MRNTDCSKCVFSFFENTNKKCYFNIPDLIFGDYTIKKNGKHDYIENYECSYAFSKNMYEKHEKDFLKIKEIIYEQNSLTYYLIVDCYEANRSEIANLFKDHIYELNTLPSKVSIITNNNTEDVSYFLNHYQTNIKDTPWKIHNVLNEESEESRLFDILNVNTIKDGHLIYIKYNSINTLQEDLNYVNFLARVKKPNYAAIKKRPEELDGLAISAKNLRLIKFDHKSEYINFLKNDDKLVRYYYE